MKRLLVVWIILIAILLLASAGWGLVWIFSMKDTVPNGVQAGSNPSPTLSGKTIVISSANQLSLGGLPIHEAHEQLNAHAGALLQLPITITAGNTKIQSKTWTLEELGMHVDISDAQTTLDGLSTGSTVARAAQRWQFPKQLYIDITWDSQIFEKEIRGQWGYIDASEPVNATRTITTNDNISYTNHQVAYRLDTGALFTQVVAAAKKAMEENWAVDAKPVTLKLMVKTINPNVTLEQLKGQGIQRKISEFTTDFSTSGSGRIHNVTVTANTLHDWELAPGEVFDYAKIIEAAQAQYGFLEAPVILNGELVPGIGGGICQVSSTLYNAALLAGLEMTERRNHSLPVSYLPKGRDATFAEGSINFRFKNSTGKHLLVRTEVSGRKLTVKLFGTMADNIRYELDSNTVSVIKPPVKTVVSATVLSGTRLLLTAGKPGYVVETYRTMYRDGKAVSRKRISRDTYKAQAAVYGVSAETETRSPKDVRSSSPSKEAIIEDGVRN